jgi:hypothetical protein
MSSVPPRLRRAYLVGNGLAMGVTLLAGLINLVLGPRNLLILAVVPFQLASTVLFFAEAVGQQPEAPPPFWLSPARAAGEPGSTLAITGRSERSGTTAIPINVTCGTAGGGTACAAASAGQNKTAAMAAGRHFVTMILLLRLNLAASLPQSGVFPGLCGSFFDPINHSLP